MGVVQPIRTRRTNDCTPGPAAGRVKTASASGFAPISGTKTPTETAQLGAASAASTLGALIALQEKPHQHGEVVWAEHSLTLLDQLHQAMLADTLDAAALHQLKKLAGGPEDKDAGARPAFGALRDALLVRVRVELAKRGIE